MSLEYIRKHYGVPAKRGAEILFSGHTNCKVRMVIIGSKNQYIKCRVLTGANIGAKTLIHPTWEIEYL